MIKQIIKEIESIDIKVIKIINYGFLGAFAIGIMGLIMLLGYNTYGLNYDIYEAGMLLIRTGFIFAAESFACGFLFDKLNKQ